MCVGFEIKPALKHTIRTTKFIDSEAEESNGEEGCGNISSISSDEEGEELDFSSDDPFNDSGSEGGNDEIESALKT